jgi:hypothetical protein
MIFFFVFLQRVGASGDPPQTAPSEGRYYTSSHVIGPMYKN